MPTDELFLSETFTLLNLLSFPSDGINCDSGAAMVVHAVQKTPKRLLAWKDSCLKTSGRCFGGCFFFVSSSFMRLWDSFLGHNYIRFRKISGNSKIRHRLDWEGPFSVIHPVQCYRVGTDNRFWAEPPSDIVIPMPVFQSNCACTFGLQRRVWSSVNVKLDPNCCENVKFKEGKH